MRGFTLHEEFLAPESASRLCQRLWQELPWQARDILLFGRWVKQPRLIAFHGDSGVSYRYSHQVLDALPWTPTLLTVKRRVERHCQVQFNCVLANAYRDGNDSMGWHSDDEPELGPQPVIASLSLGATRLFRIRPRRPPGKPQSIALQGGSLLLMSGRSQTDWQHALPRSGVTTGLRINLTFRRISTDRVSDNRAPAGRTACDRDHRAA